MDQIEPQLLQEVKILVEKVCKATVKTMAELTASKATNVDLVEALKQKEKRKNREKGNDGKAQLLDENELEK